MTDGNEIRDPVAEVIEEDDGAKLVVELPGVSQDTIKMGVSGDILKLDAEGKRGKFSTVQVIPFEPDPERIAVTFSQGVLEVDLRKRGEEPKPDEAGPEEELSITLGSMEKELELLKQELGRVLEEKSSMEERFNLLQRDVHNIRRRHETEKESIADRKVKEIATGLVEVLDSFSYAKGSIVDNGRKDKNLDGLLKGVEMVENQVLNLFKNIGITIIPAKGQSFDPNFHEAVGFVEDHSMPDEIVAKEIKRGYLYKGTTLRPAQVQVNRNPHEDSPGKDKKERSSGKKASRSIKK
jgi:molecular chaperone GrpE